jgi:hypothetical protein
MLSKLPDTVDLACTMPEHRRKGYATMLMARVFLAAVMASPGADVVNALAFQNTQWQKFDFDDVPADSPHAPEQSSPSPAALKAITGDSARMWLRGKKYLQQPNDTLSPFLGAYTNTPIGHIFKCENGIPEVGHEQLVILRYDSTTPGLERFVQDAATIQAECWAQEYALANPDTKKKGEEVKILQPIYQAAIGSAMRENGSVGYMAYVRPLNDRPHSWTSRVPASFLVYCVDNEERYHDIPSRTADPAMQRKLGEHKIHLAMQTGTDYFKKPACKFDDFSSSFAPNFVLQSFSSISTQLSSSGSRGSAECWWPECFSTPGEPSAPSSPVRSSPWSPRRP